MSDIIELRKKYSRINSEVNKEIKPEACYLCGGSKRIINSHSIPAFVLRSISDDGNLIIPHDVDQESLRLRKTKRGVNDTWTFRAICEDCDNALFSVYEEETKMFDNTGNYYLSALALKNMLYSAFNKGKNAKLVEAVTREQGVMQIKSHWYKDLEFLEKETRQYFDAFINGLCIKHKVVADITLEKKANVACSYVLIPKFDINGGLINDLHNPKRFNDDFGMMHVAVFPVKDRTRVLFYYRRKYPRYDILQDQFRLLTQKQKLRNVSNMILIYTDQFVYNKEFSDRAESVVKYIDVDATAMTETEYLSMVNYLNSQSMIFDI